MMTTTTERMAEVANRSFERADHLLEDASDVIGACLQLVETDNPAEDEEFCREDELRGEH
jgi:hypothetical protein